MYVQSPELMGICLSIYCGNGYRCYLQPLQRIHFRNLRTVFNIQTFPNFFQFTSLSGPTMGALAMLIYLFALSIIFMQNVDGRICGHEITMVNFHYTYANGQWQYNGQNQWKKISMSSLYNPNLYIWQPLGTTSWVIGPDPTFSGSGGARGHFGWCGKTDVRDCDEGDWWYWNNGWFNDHNAHMLHSKAVISGMTFRREYNGYWDFAGGIGTNGDTSSYNGLYTRVETGKTWYLFPIEGKWAIGYELPTNPVTYEPLAQCSQRDLKQCWPGTWSYVRTGADDPTAAFSCSPPI